MLLEYKDLVLKRVSQRNIKFRLKIDIVRCLADFPVRKLMILDNSVFHDRG
jgi:hypothetical protein